MKLSVFLLFFLVLSTFLSAQTTSDTTQLKKGFPVILYNDTLFYFQNQLGSLTAKERAERTSQKLHEIENNIIVSTDSVKTLQVGDNTELLYSDNIIFSLSPADGDSLKTETSELAIQYKEIIVKAIRKHREETSATEIIKRTGLGILILAILVFLIYFINKYSNKFLNYFTKKISKYLGGLRIKEYELITKAQALIITRKTFNIFKFLFIGLLIYLSLPFLFMLFPWTRSWSDSLINFVLNPLKNIFTGIINFIPNLITIVIIVFVFRYINIFLKFLSREIEAGKLNIGGFYSDWAMPTYNIFKVIIYAFMIVFIWPFIPGSNSDIFKGVSVFLGLLISIGSSSAIGNIVAGLVITYMRPFKIGDRVKIGDVTGDIIEKAFLVTRVKTIKNEIITIPNGAILNGNTVNYSSVALDEGLIVHTTVTIGYDTPYKKVHEMLIEASLRCDGIVKDKAPFVLQTSLDDYYVSYQLNAYTNQPNKMAVIYSNLHQEIQNVFNENGVEIMSPHYQALRDGNETSIPSSYRPADYQAPNFNVATKDSNPKK